jgi:hypothetical protein
MANRKRQPKDKFPNEYPWSPDDPDQWTLQERIKALVDFRPLITDEAIQELDPSAALALRIPVGGVMTISPLPIVGIAAKFTMLGYRYGWVSPRAPWVDWSKAPEGRFYLDRVEAILDANVDDLIFLMTTLIRCERFYEGTLQGAFQQGHIRAICERAEMIYAQLRDGVAFTATRFDDVSRRTPIGLEFGV